MLKLWERDIKLLNLGSAIVIWSMTTAKLSYCFISLSSSWIGRENDTKLSNLHLTVVFLQMTTAETSYKYNSLN